MSNLIKFHYQRICDEYGEENVFFVFLYGSQNYGIDTPDSDIDTKAVVFLSDEELFWRHSIDTHIYFQPNGICQILDVVTFIQKLLSYDLTLLEVFISKHIIINPKYESFFDSLKALERELFDRDPKSFLRELIDLAKEDWEHFHRHKKNTTDLKTFLHAFRLISVAMNFIDTNSYGFSVQISEPFQNIYKDSKKTQTIPQNFYELYPIIYSRVKENFDRKEYQQGSIKSFQLFCKKIYDFYRSH